MIDLRSHRSSPYQQSLVSHRPTRPSTSGTTSPTLPPPKKSPLHRRQHSASFSSPSSSSSSSPWAAIQAPRRRRLTVSIAEHPQEHPLQDQDFQPMEADIEEEVKEEAPKKQESTKHGSNNYDGDDLDGDHDLHMMDVVQDEDGDENVDEGITRDNLEPAILRLCPEVLALIFHYVYVTPVVRRPVTTTTTKVPTPRSVEGTYPQAQASTYLPSSSSSSSTLSSTSPPARSTSPSPSSSTTVLASSFIDSPTTSTTSVTPTSDPSPSTVTTSTTTITTTAGPAQQKRKSKSTVYIQNDLSSMLALCLTCRAFYPQAVRLLWRQRTLANDEDLAEFYEAIDFSRSLRKRHQKQKQIEQQQRQRLGMGYAMEEGLFNNEAALRIKSLTLLDMSLSATLSPISSSTTTVMSAPSSSSSATLPLAAVTSVAVGSSSSGPSTTSVLLGGSDPLSNQFFGSSSNSHGDSSYPLAGGAGLNLCRGIDSLTGTSGVTSMDEGLTRMDTNPDKDLTQASSSSWATTTAPSSTAASPLCSPTMSKRRLRQKTSSVYSDTVSPRLLHAIANHCYALVDLTICMDKTPTNARVSLFGSLSSPSETPVFQPTIAFSILAGSLLSLKRLTLMGLVCDPSQNKTGPELLLFAQQAQPLERISIRSCQGISLETYVEFAIRSQRRLLSIDFQGLDFASSQELTDMMGAYAYHCRDLLSVTLSCLNPLSLDGMIETLVYYRAFQIQEMHVLGHDSYRTQVAVAPAIHPNAAVNNHNNNNNNNNNAPEGGGLATVPITQLCHITDANVTLADLAKLSLRRLTLYCPGITDYALIQYLSQSPQVVDLVLNEPTTILHLPQFHTFVQQQLPPPPPQPQAALVPMTADAESTNAVAPTATPTTPTELPQSQSFTSAGFFTILFKKSPWLKYLFMKLTLDTAQEWITQPCFKDLGFDKCLYQYKTATGAPAVVLMWDTRGSNFTSSSSS
ncbi:hypothetical protein BGZ83_011781 [Gryganskiella cystojenkinii]|nr:hypothetical protein BGZ83_011781 [Gryganskiella cystojenkinii]